MTKQADKHIDDSSTRRSCAGADAKKISVPHKLVLVSENSGSEKPEQKNNEVENPEPDNQKTENPETIVNFPRAKQKVGRLATLVV